MTQPASSPEDRTTALLDAVKAAGASEQRVVERLKAHRHISRNAAQDFEGSLTLGQRLADKIAVFGGSWTFILIFLALLLAWVVLNTLLLTGRAVFDAYPFVFLNLILSMLAALQAPVIMMSQNRHAAQDRMAAEHDYEVNLKAELEILALHQKVDTLREQQWLELVAMQREQIALLTRLLEGGAAAPPTLTPS
jgi:uncharacterized membrane protein